MPKNWYPLILVAMEESAMEGHRKFRELKKYSSTEASLFVLPEIAVTNIAMKYRQTMVKSNNATWVKIKFYSVYL